MILETPLGAYCRLAGWVKLRMQYRLLSALVFPLQTIPRKSTRVLEEPPVALMPSADDTDQELFRQIAAGNAAAFESFYYRSYSRVYHCCLRAAKSAAKASELMQDAYVKLWDKRHKLVDVQYPQAYMMKITSRCIYDYITNPANRRQIVEINEETTIMAPGEVDEEYSRKLLMQLIEEAVQQLPPQQQTVFRLSKYEGLSYKEIGEQLQIAVPTVSANLVEAMKKVRAHVFQVEK